MEQNGILVDTSFLIRLLNEADPLHESALDYFRYFLENDFVVKVSTIAIAEYCVRGDMDDLPFRNMLVVPFNIDHATAAGKLMAMVYREKELRGAKIAPRAIVPNDTKMFAQAHVEEDIRYYATSDVECKKVYDLIKQGGGALSFQFIDITTPYDVFFGELKFTE